MCSYADTPCVVLPNVKRNINGYGICQVRRFDVIVRLRHRLAWIDAHNQLPPPDKPSVLHHCDNPPCEEPTHLYVGTQADNMRDASDRGRFSSRTIMTGEKAARAKLTTADVRDIRARCAAGQSQSTVANAYSITQANVSLIVLRRTWVDA